MTVAEGPAAASVARVTTQTTPAADAAYRAGGLACEIRVPLTGELSAEEPQAPVGEPSAARPREGSG